jgi:hypothetical protein
MEHRIPEQRRGLGVVLLVLALAAALLVATLASGMLRINAARPAAPPVLTVQTPATVGVPSTAGCSSYAEGPSC